MLCGPESRREMTNDQHHGEEHTSTRQKVRSQFPNRIQNYFVLEGFVVRRVAWLSSREAVDYQDFLLQIYGLQAGGAGEVSQRDQQPDEHLITCESSTLTCFWPCDSLFDLLCAFS